MNEYKRNKKANKDRLFWVDECDESKKCSIDPFEKFLYMDAKFRAMKELMNMHPDLVLLLGRK